MKKFLLRHLGLALKIFFISICFINGAETFAQQLAKCYADKDRDGFGDPNDFTYINPVTGTCSFTINVENGLDCDDNDSTEHPDQVWYQDLDNDGFTTGITLVQCERPPGYKLFKELHARFSDCGFTVEVLDAIDCDENTPNIPNNFLFWFIDNDRDGAVASFDFIFSCSPPPDQPGIHYVGFTIGAECGLQLDCNDNNAFEKPGQEWYIDADGDGFPLNNTPEYTQCQKPAGAAYKSRQQLISVNEDCNDQNAAIFPGTWYEDQDGDGLTTGNYEYACVQPAGYIFLPNGGGILDCDDTDRDATISRDWYPDVDGDRHGNPAGFVQACKRPVGYFSFLELLSANDCNDNNGAVHPGATEFCNGIDDDCDGLIDETYCCPTGNILYVNATNTGVQDGTSWVKAFKHLQDALEVARRCNNVEQIWVAGGSYYPDEGGIATGGVFQPRGGLAIYGGFTGTETLLSQRDLSSAASILSGEVQQDGIFENNISNVVILDNISTQFVLDGFTIRDGYSNAVLPLNKARGIGLLVLNSTSAVQIRNCTFRNNVGNYGAAITNVSSMPEYINCVITDNTTMLSKGAIWNDNASPRFVNCSIANNAIFGSDIIIIRNTGSAFPVIINSIVRGTSPAMDGGTPLVFYSYIQNESVWPGIGNINNDPLFVDEANGNLRLQPGSPAINAGAYDLAPINFTVFNNELTDIEGKPRIIFQIDMGAYESTFECSVPSQWVLDKDNDDYYIGEPVTACTAPEEGYTLKGNKEPGDCNDDDPAINPETIWYRDADNDGYSNTTTTLTQCTRPAGYKLVTELIGLPPTFRDCNDFNAAIHTGALEALDGVDNDCDGAIDEGLLPTSLESSTSGFQDYIIPVGISSVNLTVQGAKGGSIKRQDMHGGIPQGLPITLATGGRGTKLNAKFKVETNCQQGLKPGGKLRLITGGTPGAIIRNQEVPAIGGTPPMSFGQGGGGGTAILYQAPGTSSWVVLAVAGGGGGAFSRIDGFNSLNSSGIAAIQQNFDPATTGSDGMGGNGVFFDQVIPGGDPRGGGGQIITINISSGGGGAFGDGTLSCGGKKGMDEGGVSGDCPGGNVGGYGFGGGGGGINRLDDPLTPTDNEEGGGGGGGGYSGGKGGGNATGGFGGGSYISDLAIQSSWLTSSTLDGGSTAIVTDPIDNSGCCDPETLAFTGSYADVNLSCNTANPDGSLGTATATDATGAVTVTSADGPVVSDGCNRSRTRTFTATDDCGNTTSTSRTVRWIADVTPPTLNAGGTTTSLGCNPSSGDINGALGTATATDACSNPTVTSSDGNITSDGCLRSQTRIWTARDACGKTSTASRTVTWTADVTPPVITAGGTPNILGCNPSSGDVNGALGTAAATDACGNPTVSSSDGTVTSNGCTRRQTRTWTAIDACGNTSTASRTVTWTSDNTPPLITTGGTTTTLGCNPSSVDINGALGTATATDGCGIATVSAPSDGIISNNGCSRSKTRTWTAIDACGNTSTMSRTVSWVSDINPPVFVGSYVDIPLGCNPADIVSALGSATATDACGSVSITSNDGGVNSLDCVRWKTRTFTATDECGNTSRKTRTLSWTEDVTPPTLTTGGGALSLGCNPTPGSIDGALGTASATDACGNPTVSSSDGAVTSNGCSRMQTRIFRAIDACGNTSTAARAANWTADITPPTLTTGGGSLSLGCNPTPGAIDGALGTASATEACGNPTVTSSDGNITSNGCSRSQTRTFRAIDACGNTSTAARSANWTADITPPSLISGGGALSLGCNPTPAAIDAALSTASATDACGNPTVSSSDGAVTSNGCARTQTRTFTAKDACGNTSTVARMATWIYDKTAPTLTSGGTTPTLGWNPNASAIEGALGTATATDACGDVTVTSGDGSVSSDGCSRSQTRTFTAKDACGNTSTVSRIVSWKYDVTAPTINCPSNQTVYLSSNCTASLPNYISLATASDNCTAPASITITQYPAAETPLSGTGTQTVTLRATDAAGNTVTCSFTVNRVDNTPPVITNASPSIYVLSPANHGMRNVVINYSLTDNCGTINSVLSVTSDEPTIGTGDGDTDPDWEMIDNHNIKLRAERSGSGDGRVYTITIKATDASGNTSISSVEVRVTHNITSPQSGKSFKVGSTVSLEGEFWDKPGNNHSATWLIDDNTTVKGTVTEPTATKNGKVTGSYKFTAPGVYKLQMNTKDQNNVVSYANTSGDLEAIIVIYDPNGGYTHGGGYFNSQAGAVTSNASATGKASYGFSVNYFKGATYPKGETQFEFKVGEFEFNALNFEYMSIAGAKAQMKGTGKIIGGQSGINFILTVTDGQLDGTGIDRIRMKIYNKNTMEVYYDNQPGASDAVNPITPVQESSTVVISGSNVTDLTQSNQTITKAEQDIAPLADDLQVRVMPNPSSTNFRIVVNSNDLKAPVKLLVTDMLGRVIETRITNAGQTITIGDKYISGTYAVRIMQGRKTKHQTLIKLSD